jgi:hypothetical protein
VADLGDTNPWMDGYWRFWLPHPKVWLDDDKATVALIACSTRARKLADGIQFTA